MKFNDMTYTASLVVLGGTALYTILYSGLMGVLVSAAIGFIAYAFLDQFELVVAVTVLFAFFYTMVLKKYVKGREGFQNENNPTDIKNRLAAMKKGYHPIQQSLKDPRREPAGVYDPAVEGFEDVQPDAEKEGVSQESSSAPAKATSNQINEKNVKEITSAISEKKKTDKEITKEEMESATNQLFKLGKMPSEHPGGPKLDAGQTMVKAMDSLDPNTIHSMTADTKKLLETQKSLMGMLGQMRPVLADGKELLQTFQGMFGGGGGGMFKLGE